MPRRPKKYHYIYRTTNKINAKFYVGMHSTDDLNDGYLGSGKYLWNSIRKYGKENFEIEFLEFFDTREKLKEREKEIVNEKFLEDPMCMNLRNGGEGGAHSKEACSKGAYASHVKRKWLYVNDLTYKEKIKSLCIKNIGKLKPFEFKAGHTCWKDRKHTEKTKEKMRLKAVLRIGEKNSQFGTCWIIKGKENKKIKKPELEKWLALGWKKGRKIKSSL